jgi:hypothetical protein
MCYFVFFVIVVPLPPGTNPFAVDDDDDGDGVMMMMVVTAYLLLTVHFQTLHHLIPPAANKLSCEYVKFPSKLLPTDKLTGIINQ